MLLEITESKKPKVYFSLVSWLRRNTSWNLSKKLSPTITLRCAAAPSLHLQKGSTCITGSATQSAYHYQPQRSNRSSHCQSGSSTSLLRLWAKSRSSPRRAIPPLSGGATKMCTMSLIARRSRWTPRTLPSSSIPTVRVSSRSSRTSYFRARRVGCLSTQRYTN